MIVECWLKCRKQKPTVKAQNTKMAHMPFKACKGLPGSLPSFDKTPGTMCASSAGCPMHAIVSSNSAVDSKFA